VKQMAVELCVYEWRSRSDEVNCWHLSCGLIHPLYCLL